EGEVHAPEVELDGVLEGTCEATSVAILAHGRLQGICRGGTLSIQPGGVFLGPSQALGEAQTNVTPPAGGKGKESKESKKAEPAPEAK
ncbi:polymer-forming cytoskeletal protein, partial [Aeromonas dhakensis]|uniref:bactofilin family protein n=1 Tax=Aeromonas dhakensis TaxID=196024 RepID=UPI0038B5FBE2